MQIDGLLGDVHELRCTADAVLAAGPVLCGWRWQGLFCICTPRAEQSTAAIQSPATSYLLESRGAGWQLPGMQLPEALLLLLLLLLRCDGRDVGGWIGIGHVVGCLVDKR